MRMLNEDLNNVQKFYKDKSIFITGGSGFMGKVLVEKLLYSCPVKQIFILMRPKKGKSVAQRMEEMFKLPLFVRIRNEKPESFRKLVPVIGDISSSNMGLSNDQLVKVIENTDIVFHMAATLKLEATLKPSVEMNLIGTKNVIDLAKKMPNLKTMMHLSTAFCNSEQEIMEEKVYDCPDDPNELIRCAKWMKEEAMAELGKSLIAPHPNTYTYTKRLAEILVRDEFSKLPICIVRPSIVTPTYMDPIPGWVDNLNGPVGVLIGASKGVIRAMLVDSNGDSEIIPVDLAINGLIVISYVNGTLKEKPKEIPVYNVTCNEERKLKWGTVLEMGRKVNFEYPLEAGLWYPDGKIMTNKLEYQIRLLLFHWLPAYFIDFLMICLRQKRFLVRIQNRITLGLDLLSFFTLRKWNFKSDNFQSIHGKVLNKDEHEMFFVDTTATKNDEEDYLKNIYLGARQYILKEPLTTLPKARIQIRALWLLDRFCKVLFIYYITMTVLRMTGLQQTFQSFFINSSK